VATAISFFVILLFSLARITPSPEGHGNPSLSLLCHSDGALTTEESHFLFPLSLRSHVVATAISFFVILLFSLARITPSESRL